VTDVTGFRAQRLVIVRRPQPGIWTVRVAGRGVAGVIVQARSPLGIATLEFAPAQGTTFTALPTFGVENALRMQMTGHLARFQASLVSGVDVPLGPLPVSAGDTEASYVSRFTPSSEGFRVMIVGEDAEGFAVQRMYAPLLLPCGEAIGRVRRPLAFVLNPIAFGQTSASPRHPARIHRW